MIKKEELVNRLSKEEWLIMLAPSYIVDFSYPNIIGALKHLGFDKITELTFGAKLVNKEYHAILKESESLKISSVCPGVVETICTSLPEHKKELVPVDSPMIAMAKVCKKNFPNHKIAFLAPCAFKRIEAEKSKIIDAVLTFKELNELFAIKNINLKKFNKNYSFDSFYNEYTKIYPVSGGLSKTVHLKGILKKEEIKVIGGIKEVRSFLKRKDSKIKFLDCTFCKGGCIGGPEVSSKLSLSFKKRKVIRYMKKSQEELMKDA